MKVKDLIKELEKHDINMDVEVFCEGDDFVSQNSIDKVEIRKDITKEGRELIIIEV